MSESLQAMPLAESLARIDPESDMPVIATQQNEHLLTVLYTPRGDDHQQPHNNDEIYVVARGSAVLETGGSSAKLKTGDAAFVAAKAKHQFTEISDDFAVWAIFPGAV